MGVVLTDQVDETRRVFINWWNWRPTVALLGELGLIDEERLEMMGYNGGGAKVSEEECRAIAERLRRDVLPHLEPGARLKLDGSATTEPDDFQMHYDDIAKNYSATRAWLINFAEFCATSAGFTVF